MAITVWQEKAERARAALANLREKTKSAVVIGQRSLMSVAAGGLAGAVRGAFEASGKDYSIPGPGGAKIPPELAIGGLAMAVALSGQTDVSDSVAASGAGVLAYSAGREAENYMRARGAKTPGAVQ
jgi:hypothetical protein